MNAIPLTKWTPGVTALDMLCAADPCDGWPWRWPLNGYRMPAERAAPVCLEGFEPRDITPDRLELAPFMVNVRTDWHRWPDELDWTLESGPDDAPSSIDIVVPFKYSGGTGPTWTDPGDPPELETGVAWFIGDHGGRCEVVLLPAEQDRVDTHIHENPPEPDYFEDDR